MLKFHWRLIQAGEAHAVTRAAQSSLAESALLDLDAQADFCRSAEESGIDSLLVDLNSGTPDPMVLALALACHTRSIKFIVAVRSSSTAPALFVQQVNTFSALTNGRISLNIVAGHTPEEQRSYGDFLGHDERYARTNEFLEICRRFWQGDEVDFEGVYFRVVKGKLKTPFVSSDRNRPEIFIGGGSEPARRLTEAHGDCWMRLADTPEAVLAAGAPVLQAGKQCGLRLSVIPRATKEEAIAAGRALVDQRWRGEKDRHIEQRFVNASDSHSISAMFRAAEQEWLTPVLWTGAVRSHGAPSIALVGSYEEIADAFMDYARAGVSQFIISGWPKLDTMICFGREVLPRIRAREKQDVSISSTV
ncbi:MAG TPA: LLM class flavin-dependent oxidoreductase [Candidatus Angelobacter sp.]